MKFESDNLQNKPGRYKHFQMLINLGLINVGVKTNLWSNTSSLIDIFTTTNFVRQSVLEKILYNLEIRDRGRFIELESFAVQLERDNRTGIPYWNILLKTKFLTTGRCVSRAISEQIFDIIIIHPTIQIHPIASFEKMDKNRVFSISDSDWHPGYFTQQTVALTILLEKKEVQQSIHDAPDKYSILIKLK
jgi:hypothetical protein